MMIEGRHWAERWMCVAALAAAWLLPGTQAFAVGIDDSASKRRAARDEGDFAPVDSEEPVPADTPASNASPWQYGPRHLELGHDLGLDLPEGDRFLPREPAVKVLESMGNFHNDGVLGLATSADDEPDWLVVIAYHDEGYVKDDEPIDAAALLSDLREGTEAANEERRERGFGAVTLEGWAEPPHYEPALHHLVWALIASSADGKSVNFNTRILGRRGYASINLVTDPDGLAAHKPQAATLLGLTRFADSARYEDFDSAKDKTAEYGLAGLVAAGAGLGAAKLVKIGLLAKFWNVVLVALVAGKKFIVLALVAAGGLVKRWLGARRKGETPG